MLELKQKLVDQILKVFDAETKQLDMQEIAFTILHTFTETIFRMQPQKIEATESIFDEQPDLISNMVQKSVKLLFRDF